MTKFNGISLSGETGEFSVDSEQIHFIDSAGTPLTQQSSDVVAAEWFHGDLSILMASDDTLNFQGFDTVDFDRLQAHFSVHFHVNIHKSHQGLHIQAFHFDEVLGRIENNCAKMDEALQGSVQRKTQEVELAKSVEVMQDILENVLTGGCATFHMFNANSCERIRRLRSVIGTQQSKIHTDQHWQTLQNHCASIETILQDPGSLHIMTCSHSSHSCDSKPSSADYNGESPLASPRESTQMHIPEFGSNDSLVEVIASEEVKDEPEESMTCSLEEEFEIMKCISDIRTVNAMTSTTDLQQLQGKASILKEGWLWKRSRHLNMWRKRWFVLTPHYLASFKKKGKAQQPTECINAGSLLGILPINNMNSQGVWFRRKHEFCILCQGFSIVLSAENEAQESEWISVLTAQMHKVHSR